MMRMATSRGSSSPSWETLQARTQVKQEEVDLSPCRSSLTSSPPLCSPGVDRFPSVQESETQTSAGYAQPEVNHMAGLRRPELTFSIERILGLGCTSSSVNTQPIVAAAVPDRRMFTAVVAGNTGSAIYHGRNNSCIRRQVTSNDDDVEDDDIDDDDDDDDDEDDESVIDVGGPGEGSQFMSRPEYEYSGELSCLNKDGVPNYQWLHCTRYHPPKLQRKFISFSA